MPDYLHETIKAKSAVRALEEIEDSLGWKLVSDWIHSSNRQAIEAMNNPKMEEREMHFQRGSIAATQNFTNIPKIMTQYFQAQLLLDTAKAAEDKK